jgi:hypothetical protein
MPLWISDLAIVLVFVGAAEVAFRVGRAGRDHDVLRAQVATVQASTLGLLALLLGFTMAMADSRFDARRKVNLLEANAIGTTYLRADFLSEPERSETRRLLREYVGARRDYFEARPGEDEEAASARAQSIHDELWKRAAVVGRAHPDWEVLGAYVKSLNEMIDAEASRDLVVHARVPATVRMLVLLVALASVGITGYATGLARLRNPLSLFVLPCLVAVSCALILDLDRSRAGFISTGDAPMQRLERTLTRSSTL